jgi:DNA-binding response OmpR family regulator
MHILLIEPDHVLADTYRQALQDNGHQITTVPTAQAAISAADAQKPDLVILELQLVEHSGIEFLYEFRSYPDWQGIPVIVHSLVPPGEFSASQAILHDELGVTAYLYKPHASLRQLLRQIDQQAATPA